MRSPIFTPRFKKTLFTVFRSQVNDTVLAGCNDALSTGVMAMTSFDICFLNRQGALSCQMSGLFVDNAHAMAFAREVIRTRSCKPRFFGAEVHSGNLPPVIAGSLRIGSVEPRAPADEAA
jgi:hypothetical protein